MKRISVLFITLVTACANLFAIYDYFDGKIYYNLNTSNNTATVTWGGAYSSDGTAEYSGSLSIPSMITYNNVQYSVTLIGSYAFSNCGGLTSITIPNSVTSISSYAFKDCSSLSTITISNNLTSISYRVFAGCTSLTSITIPSSVTYIDVSAFDGCSALSSIIVASGNTVYDSRNSCKAIIETSTNELIKGCKNTIIPSDVTSIGKSAFKDCFGLTLITIPNSVTSIDDNAFSNCGGLTSITIPSSVTSIGSSAFYGCSGLTSISVATDNTVYDSRGNCNAIIKTSTNELIAGCNNTTFPNSVSSIGNHAFDGCSSLTSMTIPNSVTSIGKYAFRGCSGLTSINIPNKITAINEFVFKGCKNLTSITIPNSVTSIGGSAFENCSGLTSITIPNSVTSIGKSAFENCSGLKFVVIPDHIKEIQDVSFMSCTGLEKIIIDAVAPPVVNDSWFFWETNRNIPVYVPAGSIPAYQAANGWKTFTNYIEGPAPGYYMVSTSSTAGGTVLGGGSILPGDQTTLVAKPAGGCKFKQWNDGSTINPRTITVNGNLSYHATFEIDPTQPIFAPEFTSTTFPTDWQRKRGLVDNVLNGTAQPTSYSIGWDLVTVSSIFNSIHFKAHVYSTSVKYWLVSPIIELEAFDSGYLSLAFDVALTLYGGISAPTGNMDDDRFVVLACVDDTVWTKIAEWNNMGTGDFVYAEIDKIPQKFVLNMSAYGGKKNVRIAFYAESTVSDASNDLHVGNIQLNYKSSMPSYTISVTNADGGVVNGSGTYPEGQQATLTATPNTGYHFVRWSDGNTDNPRTIFVISDTTLTAEFENDQVKGEPEGLEMVDLGLSVKWASMNVGATKPEEYGLYFAWGDTIGYTSDTNDGHSFDWASYKWCKGSSNTMTKYCTQSSFGYNGFTDNKTTLEPADDAATANWGGAWRMPTDAEWTELRTKCTWTWTQVNGVNGYRVSRNGNSIFLPAAGYRYGTGLSDAGSRGYYWSASLNSDYSYCACIVYFDSGSVYGDYSYRRYGQSVRSVYVESVVPNMYTITVQPNNPTYGIVTGGGNYKENTQATLTATPNTGYHFVRWSDGNTDNPRTIMVTCDTTLTVEFAVNQYTVTLSANNSNYGSVLGDGTYGYNTQVALTATPNTGYHFVRWNDGNTDNPRTIFVTSDTTLMAEFEKDVVLPSSGSAEVLSSAGRTSCEYVQLWEGGPKWATFNVGATITSYDALHIGAEETHFYDDAMAPYYNTANVGGLYPWKNPSLNGHNTTWGDYVATGMSDVATTLWGSNWETPTRQQLDTLQNSEYGKTTWTWCDGSTIQYVTGCTLCGYKVTGVGAYAGQSIFLPAAGYLGYNTISHAAENGRYWSAQMGGSTDGSDAIRLYFESDNRKVSGGSCYYGLSVRAVLVEKVKITIEINNSAWGSVTGSGNYRKNDQATLTATPKTGYHFVQWSDGNTENPRTITVTKDLTLTAEFEKDQVKGEPAGVEKVDLGLPSGTKWANVNVGATAPEEYGDYFAWGETTPKNDYTWSTYLWCDGSNTSMNKYCFSSNDGTVDNKVVLELTDDAARVNWGGDWRMPTDSELQELIDNCDVVWTTDYNGTGVSGCIFTSRKNEKSIFLPAAGYRNMMRVNEGYGDYWASKLGQDNSVSAYNMTLYSGGALLGCRGNVYRYYGYTVRAVCPVAKFELKAYSSDPVMGSVIGSGTYNYNTRVTLTATPNAGYHFVRWSDGNTKNPRTFIVTKDVTLTAEFEKDVVLPSSGSAEVLSSAGRSSCEWVQLWAGGPKWATFNVGATINHYASLTYGADSLTIGDDFIRISDTDQAPYYNTANVGGLYAWNQPNYNGRQTTWNWDVATGAADVATTLWGSKWRTPTREQLDTLQNSELGMTIWTWCDGSSTQYVTGCTLKGYKVSGVGAYEDNSIFLPAAGHFYNNDRVYEGASNNGFYWSNTLYDSEHAYYLNIDPHIREVAGHISYGYDCRDGRSVRAVLDDGTVVYTIMARPNNILYGTVIGCGTYVEGSQVSLTAKPASRYEFVQWSDGNTENPRTITVTGDLTLTAEFQEIGTTPDNPGKEYEYVDLGLPSGTLWAKKDLGTENMTGPTDGLFAWGATNSGKTNWADYPFSENSESGLSKYSVDARYGLNGFIDGKTHLEAVDDVATQKWGQEWHIPTYEEWQELLASCTSMTNGYKRVLRSKYNNEQISFELRGYDVNGKLMAYEEQGAYWTSDLYTPRCYDATAILFDITNIMPFHALRCWGLSVRPVRTPLDKTVQPSMMEGVNDVQYESQVVKQLINGQLYIIRDGHRYTVQGQRVE